MQSPKLLTVTKNDIHVLVKCLELADEGTRVLKVKNKNLTNVLAAPPLVAYLENDPHPVVDVVHHLVVLAHHHLVL